MDRDTRCCSNEVLNNALEFFNNKEGWHSFVLEWWKFLTISFLIKIHLF